MNGNLFIVCAPSGAGKTSLVSELLKAEPRVKLSVSYTTRDPRPGEVDGRDYHFVSRQEFTRMLDSGEFLESALVHGNYYGTSQSWIAAQRANDCDILLEIDWQGAAQVRRLITPTVGIFILPPSRQALLARLQGRGQDAGDVIARRVAMARTEIGHVAEFEYVIINDNFDEAVKDLVSIVRSQRLTASSQLMRHSELINQMK